MPDHNTKLLLVVFLPVALSIIMFGMGLSLTLNDFRRVKDEPRAIIIGLIAQLALLPALGFLFAWAFRLSPPLAIGMVLLCSAPGGPTSNLLSFIGKGDVALSVSLTAVAGIITVFSIPWIVNLGVHTFSDAATVQTELPILLTVAKIGGVVVIPVTCGMWVRARSRHAPAMTRIVQRLSFCILGCLVIGAVLKERARMPEFLAAAGIAVLAHNTAALLLGFVCGRLMRLNRAQSVTISLEVGMQNAALAIGLALQMEDGVIVAIPSVIFGVWSYFSCGAVALLSRWAARKHEHVSSSTHYSHT